MNRRLLISLLAGMLTVLGTASFSSAQPVGKAGSDSYAQPVRNPALDNLLEMFGNPQQTQQVEAGIGELELDKRYKKRKHYYRHYRHHSRYSYSSSDTGLASWYGDSHDSPVTANGEYLNPSVMTAAHRTLPFGTRVLVTNMNNNRSVVVRINDRGPYVSGRSLDLSVGPARVLGVMDSGVAPVQMRILGD